MGRIFKYGEDDAADAKSVDVADDPEVTIIILFACLAFMVCVKIYCLICGCCRQPDSCVSFRNGGATKEAQIPFYLLFTESLAPNDICGRNGHC